MFCVIGTNVDKKRVPEALGLCAKDAPRYRNAFVSLQRHEIVARASNKTNKTNKTNERKLFFMFWALELGLATFKSVNKFRKSVGGYLEWFWWCFRNCIFGILFTRFVVIPRRPLKHHHNEAYSQIQKTMFEMNFGYYLEDIKKKNVQVNKAA